MRRDLMNAEYGKLTELRRRDEYWQLHDECVLLGGQ